MLINVGSVWLQAEDVRYVGDHTRKGVETTEMALRHTTSIWTWEGHHAEEFAATINRALQRKGPVGVEFPSIPEGVL